MKLGILHDIKKLPKRSKFEAIFTSIVLPSQRAEIRGMGKVVRKTYSYTATEVQGPHNKEVQFFVKGEKVIIKTPQSAGFLFCGRKVFMPSSFLQRPSS